MISQPINLKKNYFSWYADLTRIALLFVLIISVSLCDLSTSKNGNGEDQMTQSAASDTSSDRISEKLSDAAMGKYAKGLYMYDLENPDKRYDLPSDLREISGLVYYRNNEVLCVQDEKANIYVYNLDKEEVVSEYDFGKDGDYEDITLTNQFAYVIRSDGRIYEVENISTGKIEAKEYKTILSEKNDTEGLIYDRVTNSLFIACKGSPAVEKDNSYEGYKAIYQFDLGEKQLDDVPHFLVDLNKLDIYRDVGAFKKFSIRIVRGLGLSEGNVNFHPSGIAIHPLNDEIYLISSLDRIMVILDRQGNILHMQDLNSRIFRQPEGISFSPEGDLFIASEGKGGSGYILKFNLQTEG